MTAIGQRASFGRVLFILAAGFVVLAGIRLAAPVLNPILFALVFGLLFAPVYAWLQRRLPGGLALVIMLVGLLVLFVGLFFLLSASITRLTGRLGFYATQLNGQLGDLQESLDSLGLSVVDIGGAVDPGTLVGALGSVLSGIAGFLSSLFLVLMIMLFLLSEGAALMGRLRSAVASDNPQVARLTVIGQSVVRQFGLRAIVNLVTAAGISVALFVLGVDFSLLWGILIFFLSYIPYIGLVLGAAPAVLLALAEFGLGRAFVVVAVVIVVNILAENVLSPTLMGRGLDLSPTVVFLSFIFWAWLLGGPGAFLALPITLFVAVMLDTFPETRWIASLMGMPEAPVEAAPTRPDFDSAG
ncbi:MAG: AI-2E family transporter [Rubrobacteraceae bacterium]